MGYVEKKNFGSLEYEIVLYDLGQSTTTKVSYASIFGFFDILSLIPILFVICLRIVSVCSRPEFFFFRGSSSRTPVSKFGEISL
jgi:hypothetical protein